MSEQKIIQWVLMEQFFMLKVKDWKNYSSSGGQSQGVCHRRKWMDFKALETHIQLEMFRSNRRQFPKDMSSEAILSSSSNMIRLEALVAVNMRFYTYSVRCLFCFYYIPILFCGNAINKSVVKKMVYRVVNNRWFDPKWRESCIP